MRRMNGAQDDVLTFLASGAAFGVPGTAVERIDTHISAVFLVGERAFKLKRAVAFSYLDYSTPARRREFCERELELGRRLAPRLYRAVRKVTREADGRLAIDGRGSPVDWLVEMRRFDQAALFDRLAEAGRLDPALMIGLADRIAEFHGDAPPTPDHGGAAAIRAVIDDDARNLALAPRLFGAAAIAALTAASHAALDRVAGSLDRRRASGKVRRCHGDLHLRNICLFEGAPTLFDGIEFNDDIACVDVLYDLAFLLMDLQHRGRTDLANRVFNRYFDRTDEADGLAALPLLISLRAAIRAHVSAAAAARQADESRAAQVATEARSYFALAREVLEPKSASLVAIGGLSGTGKTTLAYALAPSMGAVPGARVLRSDVLRKRLLGVAPETRLPENAYDQATSDRVYEALGAGAAGALAGGGAVIADAAFLRPEERTRIEEVAQRGGLPFAGLWLEAPAAIMGERLDRRIRDASDADAAVMRRQRQLDVGAMAWHRVAAGGDLAATAAAAREHLAMMRCE